MTIEYWVGVVSGNALVLVALWLSRNLIANRLTRSVQHEFDKKLYKFQSAMREKEEEIGALRQVALSALENRSTELNKRRIVAVDELWHATTELTRAKFTATLMQTIKLEEASKAAPTDEGVRAMFGMMLGNLDIKTLDLSGASRARPYLSPMAWAMYSAYHALLVSASMNAMMIKGGTDIARFLKKGSLAKLVKAALPHYANFLDEHGEQAAYFLLEELEQGLIEALQDMLAGKDVDDANVKQASEILKQAEFINAATGAARAQSSE
ncbi:MAG: hypothetical protein K2X67_03425 [Burkholderiales bacterium]|jgi:hypothetical protein|nr:hypothetical protein [Burkholderiales bacterium]